MVSVKPAPRPKAVVTVHEWSDRLRTVPLEALRFRRDRAVRCGDLEEALACAIAIDKKRGLYGPPPGPPQRSRKGKA